MDGRIEGRKRREKGRREQEVVRWEDKHVVIDLNKQIKFCSTDKL